MSQNRVNGGFNGNPLRNEVEPSARKILRTDQPIILAGVGHVQQAAVFQSFPVAPFRWENRLAFRGRGHRCFLHCKDLLPKKCDLSRDLPDFGGKILCNPLRKAVGIFCQTLPLTMKNKNQNTVSGGRAAEGNFRQYEIRGQRCQRGWFSSNHFPVVIIYYRKNADFRGLCADLLVKHCSIFEPGGRNFPPCWCRMKIIGQSWFERRQKNRANHCQNPRMGFVASVALEARQISCKACKGRPPFPVRVPATMKIISVRLATRETKMHFVSVGYLCRFAFGQDSN
jgi:hypothetical protein